MQRIRYTTIFIFTSLWGDVNAEFNYFFTININLIEDLIYDKNDVEESQQIHIGEVDYIPFLTEEYPYAGIQSE